VARVVASPKLRVVFELVEEKEKTARVIVTEVEVDNEY